MWLQLAADDQITRTQLPHRHTITRTRWNTQPLASGHLALYATGRTFIFRNIVLHFHVSTLPPKFRVTAHSTTVQRSIGEQIEPSIQFAALYVIELFHLLQISEKKIHGKLFFLVPCSCNMLTRDIWIFTKLGQSKYSNWIFKQLFLRKRSVEQQ